MLFERGKKKNALLLPNIHYPTDFYDSLMFGIHGIEIYVRTKNHIAISEGNNSLFYWKTYKNSRVKVQGHVIDAM